MRLARSIFYFLPVVLAKRTPQLEPRCSSSLALPQFNDLDILSTKAALGHLPDNNTTFCNFSTILTHPGEGDAVYVNVWLPITTWNHRLLVNGGGGFTSDYGLGETLLVDPVKQGYATAYTDAGLTVNRTIDPNDGKWALNVDGTTNTALLKNFASRGIHDTVVVSKAAIRAFYGSGPAYSYYSGCSTGGRQGYFAAQFYPTDFDGVMANSPSLYFDRDAPTVNWPYVVLKSEETPVCVLQAVAAAILTACDGLDGVQDGVILEPWKCGFDFRWVVGATAVCDAPTGNITITTRHADAVSKIFRGPTGADGGFLWYGLAEGTTPVILANTTVVGGEFQMDVDPLAYSWARFFVDRDASAQVADMTYSDFDDYFAQSVKMYSDVLGNEDPDLSAFQRHGGKLLTWNGMVDPIVYHGTTLRYREKILEKTRGGEDELHDFYRVFLAPGASHCEAGAGPAPVDAFAALVDWVELGEAPDSLPAVDSTHSWDLCVYPRVLQPDGSGGVVCGLRESPS